MKYALLTLTLLISTNCYAVWSNRSTVVEIYSYNGKHFVETNISNNPCGAAGKFWWSADDSDAKEMFSLALSAFMTGKKIRVIFNELTPNCDISGAEATHMGLSDR